MSWNEMYYGKARPSILRKLLVNGLVLNIVLCLVGMIGVDFVPSDAWMFYGFSLCVGLAVFFSAWVYLGHYRGDLKSGRNSGPILKIASFVALPFLFFAIFWFSVVYALSDIATRVLGEDKSITEYVTTHSTDNSAGRTPGALLSMIFCRNYIEGPALDNAFLSRICFYRNIPGNSRSASLLELQGTATPLGFHVDKIEDSSR